MFIQYVFVIEILDYIVSGGIEFTCLHLNDALSSLLFMLIRIRD